MSTMTPNDCPFCGGSNLEMGNTPSFYWVRCQDCGAEGPTNKDRKEAVELWNGPTDELDRMEVKHVNH